MGPLEQKAEKVVSYMFKNADILNECFSLVFAKETTNTVSVR